MNSSRILKPILNLRKQFIPTRGNISKATTTIGATPSFSRTMASEATHTPNFQLPNEDPSSKTEDPSSKPHAPLPLPPPPSSSSDDAHQLSVNGQGIKLDHLGPLVVNKDGSLSRIANWDKMAEIERQNTLRILGKRNQLRLGDLRGEGEGKGEEEGN